MKNKEAYIELHKKYGDIKITCQGADSLPIEALHDFQKGLKRLSNESKLKLAQLIFKQGFSFPFYLWQNNGDYFLIDGHQRTTVLCELRAAGVPLPAAFPCDYIEASTEQEAREKVLACTSQFGEFAINELDSWVKQIDKEIAESLRLLDNDMKKVFEPNLNPSQSQKEITENDIDKVRKNMENKYDRKENQIECICPSCGETFWIQP